MAEASQDIESWPRMTQRLAKTSTLKAQLRVDIFRRPYSKGSQSLRPVKIQNSILVSISLENDVYLTANMIGIRRNFMSEHIQANTNKQGQTPMIHKHFLHNYVTRL